ncbi:type I-F CRISPR-associated protein Csy1 [Marinibactrum halimedae]|uniref:type I-F CRISPR-associated protein Csy1 n=1 Tax=Marinibactrum halimedae TaxID=1444977 RepID=UPI001E553491|nr:type I-F CRISPR-associated protein Csy1 [Marinibactrum halimedae]MCD9460212.1 type I-F CRISPR-associated protein Csy1 [Marinibactrum halimedae]
MEEKILLLQKSVIEYIEKRKLDKLEKLEKESTKAIKNAAPEMLASVEAEAQEKRHALEAAFQPAVWLGDAAERAKQLNVVTHGIKYLHSDAKGSSWFSPGSEDNTRYVSTASIPQPELDIVGNAAALDVGKLLQLTVENLSVMDVIREKQAVLFDGIAESEAQAHEWIEKFGAVISATNPSTHKLAKQVYWPIDEGYHLLCPLYATSLTHAIYEKIQSSRFSETSKERRKARKKNQYAEGDDHNYVNVAVQTFGGTKPQNISQLNSSRGGKSYLFSCAPPQWETQNQPPYRVRSVFNGPLYPILSGPIYGLRKFLEANFDARSTYPIRQECARRIIHIIDLVIGYTQELKQFSPGWSAHPDCRLLRHQRLWLDQRRYLSDEKFAHEFDQKTWQAKVAEDFSRFLNKQLEKGKKLAMSDVEFVQWKVLSEQEFRLITDDIKETPMWNRGNS